jgi:hypothetical protein
MYINIQPSYILQPKFTTKDGKNIRAIEYVADFEVIYTDGTIHVVDIKGMATPEAKLKRKMLLYVKSYYTLLRLVKYK